MRAQTLTSILPSKSETPLHNTITVMTFGGWAVFMLAFMVSFALFVRTGSLTQAHPTWLGLVGLGGAASFMLATLLHSLFVFRLPKLYCRTTA